MKHHAISGGGGSLLHLIETGNPDGQPIVFIHGFSQCSLAWNRQLDSALSERFRLIALDLRGHGSSDTPRDAYGDSRLWADDVHAAIRQLHLQAPILCGWSYGPLVILDYIRHYGDDAIGGIHFVSGVTRLGSEQALSVLAPEFLALVPGFFSTDAEQSVTSLRTLLRMCFSSEPSAAELYTMLGYNVTVPPFVRQALFSRTLDNDDVLATIRKPLLITHGAADSIVRQRVVEQTRAIVRHAEAHIMAGAGHAPFWDDAVGFNRRLGTFADEVARAEATLDRSMALR